MTFRHKWITVSMLIAGLAVAMPTFAQEMAFVNRVLKKTSMKTHVVLLPLSATNVDAFTPTSLVCPGTSGTCTYRVEVTSQFRNLTAAAQMQVQIDGMPPHPQPLVAVNTTNSTGVLVHTFTWVLAGLPPGAHVVDVEFRTAGGSGEAAFRTLTVQVFKP